MEKLHKIFKKIAKIFFPSKRLKESEIHPLTGYTLLLVRNVFVSISAVLFFVSILTHGESNVVKAVAYFAGAGAYLFEWLSLTDCFKKKVDHREMFMVYCLGPLYLLMGIDYIFWH